MTSVEGEAAAQKKFACSACGGEAVWNPARQALVCASCGTPLAGTAPPAAPSSGLGRALSTALAAETGAAASGDAARIAVRCQHCDAVSYFDRGTAADRCAFCGSAEIVPYDALGDRYRPETAVPFKVSESGARDAAVGWIPIAGCRRGGSSVSREPMSSAGVTCLSGHSAPTRRAPGAATAAKGARSSAASTIC